MTFCGKCGTRLEEGAKFCGSCGQTADTTAQMAQSQALTQVTITAANMGLALAHVGEFFLQKPEFASCKIFEGLYTDVAVSESGYLGFYRPAVVGMKKMDQPEYFELIHVSQINDIDLDVDDETKVSSGAGGALIGGLLGGTTGAIIGSAVGSGKATTTIRGIDLILNTKDFQNPRRIIPLYQGAFADAEPSGLAGSAFRAAVPPSYWKQKAMNPKSTSRGFTATYSPILKNPYNLGRPPVERVQELISAINQIMAAHAEQQAKQAAAPQLSTADEILKFKQLLDAGVLTQEEFDAKKRQLMGA